MRLAMSRRVLPMLLVSMVVRVGEAVALEPTPGYPTIQRAFLREEFSTVATLAETFIAQHPDVPEASRVWIWLALSLDRLQRSNEALKELDRLKGHLSANDPVWPEVLFWEGDVSRRALQMIRAKLAYQRLLERHPDSMWTSQAYMGLGFIYLHQQAFEQAMGYFHEVAVRQPTASVALDALFFEGLCQLRLERFQEAVDRFKPLVEQLREPSVIAQTSLYLGDSLVGLRRYDDAVVVYQRAIALQPSSPWSQLAQFGLGGAYYRAGRCEESINAFEQYLAQSPIMASPQPPGARQGGIDDHRTEALFAQGSCLMQLGREQEGLSRFRRVLASQPTHRLSIDSGLAIADAYRREGRFASAKELLRTLLRQPLLDERSHAKVQLRLAAIALEQGNPEQAATIFEQASAAEELSIRQAALSGLGDVQVFLGDFAAAIQRYTQAIQVAEDTSLVAYARYQIGRLRLQLGAFDEAVKMFQQVAGSADRSVADDAKLALALTYLNEHEERLARSLLDAIREQRPQGVLAARAAYYLALIALAHEDTASARSFSQETIAKASTSDEAIEARLLLAGLMAQEGSASGAMAWLKDAYVSSSVPVRHRAKLAKRLGDLARAEGAYADAIRWYDAVAELLPSLRPEVAYRLASCYEEVGDLELARRWYERIDQPPWRVRGQLALAKLLEREDRTLEAEAIYERLAAEPIPEAQVIQERLATLRGHATDTE